METVTVLFASTQKNLCRSLISALENEAWIKVVGTSDSKANTLDMVEKLGPQIIVLDIDLAGDELEVGQEMLERSPKSKIIVLNHFGYEGQITNKESTNYKKVAWQYGPIADDAMANDLMKAMAAAAGKDKKHKIH